MTDTESIVRRALSETLITQETVENVKTIKLEELDERYPDFEIRHEYWNFGKIHYYLAHLNYIEKTGQRVPLVIVNNIAYSPNEAIEEIARVIDRFWNQ